MARRHRRHRRARTPATLRRRLTRRRGWLTVAIVLLLALLVLADRQGWLLAPSDELARYDDRVARVTRVIDGDTLEIAVPDGDEPVTTVRLWGIDTPEKARPWQGQEEEPFAEEASAYAAELVDGRRVRLDLEPHRVRGRYGRVLAYVELPGEGRVLNEELIKAGLAEAEDRWPHRHLERYETLELQARRDARGMWAE